MALMSRRLRPARHLQAPAPPVAATGSSPVVPSVADAAHALGRSTRPARRCTVASGSRKALLGVVLAFALVLSPWEPLLPQAGPQLGTPPAHAQQNPIPGGGDPPPVQTGNDGTPDGARTLTPGAECATAERPSNGAGADSTTAGVECGEADDCPEAPEGTPRPWSADSDDPSLCVLILPACPLSPPSSPLDSGQPVRYTVPSEEFPEFCEDVVSESEDHELYRQLYRHLNGVIVESAPCEVTHSLPPGRSGYAIKTATVLNAGGENVGACRIIVPGRCPRGMHRLTPGGGRGSSANANSQDDLGGLGGADDQVGDADADRPGYETECRQVKRRGWTCPPETTTPLNRFNTCYRYRSESESESDEASNPACDHGAPQFAVSNCEEYVNDDYPHQSDTLDCEKYDTHENAGALAAVESNPSAPSDDYWCQYDRRWLDLRCHPDLAASGCPNIDMSLARCIKRASNNGGCSAVAKTIRCHALDVIAEPARRRQRGNDQGDDGTDAGKALRYFQQEGCRPCTILPFEQIRPPPADGTRGPNICAPETFENPHLLPNDNLRSTLHRGGTISTLQITTLPECRVFENDQNARLSDYPNCQQRLQRECHEPSVGALESRTVSGSGVLVNSPVVITFAGTPIESHSYRYFTLSNPRKTGPPTGLQLFDGIQAMVFSGTRQLLMGQLPDPLAFDRRGNQLFPAETHSSLSKLVSASGGPCYPDTLPLSQLAVQELLPDMDHDEIVRLFGERALQRWNEDGFNKEAYIQARGFSYIDVKNADQSTIERERKARQLRQVVPCNSDRKSEEWWCRWIPQRIGFYRLTGEQAWQLKQWPVYGYGEDGSKSGTRRWAWDGQSGGSTEWFRAANDWLGMNVSTPDDHCDPDATKVARAKDADCIRDDLHQLGVDNPRDAGFAEDFQSLLEPPSDEEQDTLYRERKPYIHLCPSQDVRIACDPEGITRRPFRRYVYVETDSIGIVVQGSRVVTRQPSAP
jgi:hypothetical protein